MNNSINKMWIGGIIGAIVIAIAAYSFGYSNGSKIAGAPSTAKTETVGNGIVVRQSTSDVTVKPSTAPIVKTGTVPKITGLSTSTIATGVGLTIRGENFNSLSPATASKSRVFVNITSYNTGKKGIIWEGGSTNGNQNTEGQIQILRVPATACTISVLSNGGTCPSAYLVPIPAGRYTINVTVDGRGTSNNAELIVVDNTVYSN